MKNKNLYILFGSIVCATAASAALFFAFNVNKVDVLVGTTNVRQRTVVTPNMFTVEKYSKDYLPANYLPAEAASAVVGKYTNIGFASGQVLTTDSIDINKSSNKASTIDEGKTLYTVSTSKMPQGVIAGDNVNVLINMDLDGTGPVVLTFQNVNVTNVYKDDEGTIKGVEISVTPSQAQKIQYAVSNGDVNLSLLPLNYQVQDLPILDEETFRNEYNIDTQLELKEI